jgi:hypothetical protein
MSPFDEKLDDWQPRLARYRRFSALLGEDETMAPLHALAREMEQHLTKRLELQATYKELKRVQDFLIAEIDVVLACVRSHRVCPSGFSAADFREESRLCREEARAAADAATRRSFASRAVDFAMLGEQIARDI